jgi:cell fate regulator YaaT (PSP1 superfamily)
MMAETKENTTQRIDPYIVGLRFQKVGKIYHFDASKFRDLQPGEFVVVETSRGKQLGQITQIIENGEKPSSGGSWKPIMRKATPQDLVLRQVWKQKEVEAIVTCRAKAADMRIKDVKFVSSEYSFDGKRLIFLYSTESGDRPDLRALKKSLHKTFRHTRIEMHMVGPRDVAKIIGGMGACGLGQRCCSMFLSEFSPISIRMAKEQGISLTPTEITGMCGRLRCCLVYEYEQYVEARKKLPKRGKRVVTPLGEGRVVDLLVVKDSVIVEFENGTRHEYLKEEIQPWEELEALRKKSTEPCDKHPEGGCNCGTEQNKKKRYGRSRRRR